MDPLANEVIWDKLYKGTFWGQNGGPGRLRWHQCHRYCPVGHQGKYFNVPVYKLLGGKRREKLRTYASQLQFRWGDGVNPAYATEDYAAAAKHAVSEGYDAIKIDFFTYDRDGRQFSSEDTTRLLKPYYIDLVEERVAAVREAVGPNVDITHGVSLFHRCPVGYPDRKAGREVQHLLLRGTDHTKSRRLTKLVADAVRIPIASGERIYTRMGLRALFRERLPCLDPARPRHLRRNNRGQENMRHGLCLRCERPDPRVRESHIAGGGIFSWRRLSPISAFTSITSLTRPLTTGNFASMTTSRWTAT